MRKFISAITALITMICITTTPMKEMTGKSSFAYIGSVSDIDIKSVLLNDTTYFRRFVV